MSLPELLRLLRFAPATRSHSRPPISLHEPEFFGAPRSLFCVDPKAESAQQKDPPMRAFAQRGRHSRALVARHEQLAMLSMNRTRPIVNIQIRLKYQDSLKSSGIRPRHIPQVRPAPTRPWLPRPQGSRPALERSGQSGCAGAGIGPCVSSGPGSARGLLQGLRTTFPRDFNDLSQYTQ